MRRSTRCRRLTTWLSKALFTTCSRLFSRVPKSARAAAQAHCRLSSCSKARFEACTLERAWPTWCTSRSAASRRLRSWATWLCNSPFSRARGPSPCTSSARLRAPRVLPCSADNSLARVWAIGVHASPGWRQDVASSPSAPTRSPRGSSSGCWVIFSQFSNKSQTAKKKKKKKEKKEEKEKEKKKKRGKEENVERRKRGKEEKERKKKSGRKEKWKGKKTVTLSSFLLIVFSLLTNSCFVLFVCLSGVVPSTHTRLLPSQVCSPSSPTHAPLSFLIIMVSSKCVSILFFNRH